MGKDCDSYPLYLFIESLNVRCNPVVVYDKWVMLLKCIIAQIKISYSYSQWKSEKDFTWMQLWWPIFVIDGKRSIYLALFMQLVSILFISGRVFLHDPKCMCRLKYWAWDGRNGRFKIIQLCLYSKTHVTQASWWENVGAKHCRRKNKMSWSFVPLYF